MSNIPRVTTDFASKTDARKQVQAINLKVMLEHIPAGEPGGGPRGERAPPDATTRYIDLDEYGDGTWGHIITPKIRAMHGETIGSSPQHTVDVSAERDMPERTLPDGTVDRSPVNSEET